MLKQYLRRIAKYFITEIFFVGEIGRGRGKKFFFGGMMFFFLNFLGEGGGLSGKIFFDDGV